MPYKVIFDTNMVNSTSAKKFFGNRVMLAQFAKLSEIIIPDMVIEELKSRKKKCFEESRGKFIENPFFAIKGLDDSEIRGYNTEQYIEDLLRNEDIPYTPIYLSDCSPLYAMKALSLGNLAPFDPQSDKGFKDAYIYFTILEYLEENKNTEVFFAVADKRLQEAFAGNSNVRVVKSYDEFKKLTIENYKQEYFIKKLKDELDGSIEADDIKSLWLSREDDVILNIFVEDREYHIKIDPVYNEITDTAEGSFVDRIEELTSSGSFLETHDRISSLVGIKDYFNAEQVEQLITAAVRNDQIWRIAMDSDVRQFFTDIYEMESRLDLDEDLKREFKERFNIQTAS